MKLSVFTVATPDLSPEQLTASAKEAGLDGIEWRFKETPEEFKNEAPSFWRNNLCSISPFEDESGWDRYKQAAASASLEHVSVTPYLTAGDLKATEKVLQAAQYLGASIIRLGVPGYNRTESFGSLFQKERDYLKEAESLCKQYGVKGVIETHHATISPSASSAYRLVEGLDPKWIGVLYDPGNMVHEGFENYRMGMELLGPYLAHVHIKNAGWFRQGEQLSAREYVWSSKWVGITEGIVPLRQVIEDLRAVNYNGYLGLEDFSGQYSSVTMMKHYVQLMKELLQESLQEG
ncbi:sugar phosphate isomerase/epimerase family protein [Paenibacillus sp. GCM10012307]|uniref:Sugar phosphate isomerase/epimerase n=1 Tax=Paenibacillus roseus TaxID=2798579 RepID=A0A934MQ29_9BACL|nr:sugar phosphate isomerase/epimerase family protein [Paenibacillus roseus]MBJ6360984.1 sugar phosphate isomerase/epimerase [Paenibacillus roseus]